MSFEEKYFRSIRIMNVAATYSFNNGREYIEAHHNSEVKEIFEIIGRVDAIKLKQKISKERTKKGKKLYAPILMNREFKVYFEAAGWIPMKIRVKTFVPETNSYHEGPREIDATKNKLAVEIQLGKYAFMGYDILSKMPIFKNKGLIDSGVEIVPMRRFARDMSSGVSPFDMIKADLEARGACDLDVPVLVLGISMPAELEKETIQKLSLWEDE